MTDASFEVELGEREAQPPSGEPEACPVPSAGPGPVCDVCRSARHAVLETKRLVPPRPDRVLAIGAQLGPMFGSELVIPTVVDWPNWFDLSVVGTVTGAWGNALSGDSRWSASDDHGRSHVGVSVAGSSGFGTIRVDLTFVPALAPDARAITVVVPPCFDGRSRRATFDLGPGASSP